MKKLFNKFKEKFAKEDLDMEEAEEEYVELDTVESDDGRQKVVVRPYIIDDFSDVKPVLDALREGYTIALVNIKPLREKDLIELKRTINKIKKTCDAINGDIAGLGEDYIIVTPSFASIYRSKQTEALSE